jgi:hypothetical protein
VLIGVTPPPTYLQPFCGLVSLKVFLLMALGTGPRAGLVRTALRKF